MNSTFALPPSLTRFAFVAAALTLGSTGCAAAAATQCPSVAGPVAASDARPLVMRAEAGSIWASYRAWSEPRRAWAMPARGPVEGLSSGAVVDGSGSSGYVVTFRQGGVSWLGELGADRQSCGGLWRLGVPVETPTIAKR